ncbi:MAG: hypothetical protein AAGF28_03125 [Pseudomonadota bacterium]
MLSVSRLKTTVRLALPCIFALAVSACTSGGPGPLDSNNYGLAQKSIKVCSGYGCKLSDAFVFSAEELEQLQAIMSAGHASAEAERNAIANAIGAMEKMARKRLGYEIDEKKSYQAHSGRRGQMDCVDESLNTTQYLFFLQNQQLLKFHKTNRRYAERGIIVDGRYPHKSARIIDASGQQWTVDSWYERDGEPAQIMRLEKWRKVRNS